jgi:hypothetical protein
MKCLFLTGLLLAAPLLPISIHAQENSAELEANPCVKIVRSYLEAMLTQDWDKIATLMDTASMESFRDDYIRTVKRPGRISLDEEKELLSVFGVKDLDEIKKVPGAKFYATFHNLLKKNNGVDAGEMKRRKDSMKLTVLSVGPEGDSLAHVLMRVSFEDSKRVVKNLELISLVKAGGKWLVTLNEQSPKIVAQPRSAQKGDPAPESATPVPEEPKKTAPRAKPIE